MSETRYEGPLFALDVRDQELLQRAERAEAEVAARIKQNSTQMEIYNISEGAWKDALKRLRERVATLERALKSLRCEQLDMEPGMWGIRCIEDHNAIIDAALTAKESTPNAK